MIQLATKNQKRLVITLHDELDITLTKSRRLALSRSMTRVEASKLIDTLEALRTRAESTEPLATDRQVAFYLDLKRRLREPVSETEAVSLTRTEMTRLTQDAQRRIQARNDALGVPIPEWRFRNGLYTAEVLERCGVAGGIVTKAIPRMTLEDMIGTGGSRRAA